MDLIENLEHYQRFFSNREMILARFKHHVGKVVPLLETHTSLGEEFAAYIRDSHGYSLDIFAVMQNEDVQNRLIDRFIEETKGSLLHKSAIKYGIARVKRWLDPHNNGIAIVDMQAIAVQEIKVTEFGLLQFDCLCRDPGKMRAAIEKMENEHLRPIFSGIGATCAEPDKTMLETAKRKMACPPKKKIFITPRTAAPRPRAAVPAAKR